MRISDWSSDVCSSDLQGAGIEIERTDKNLFLVDRKGLGVETRAGRSCDAPDIGLVVYRKGWLEFVKLDPGPQEMRSVLHIGAVHGNDVGRRLRIGEYPDADARTRQLFKRIREFLARNEIGGNNIHRTRWFRQQRHKLWEKQTLR